MHQSQPISVSFMGFTTPPTCSALSNSYTLMYATTFVCIAQDWLPIGIKLDTCTDRLAGTREELRHQSSIIKVGVNPSLKREMWLLTDLITKKTCAKMYKSIHFWNQKNQMNPMVATDFYKIMQFSRNSSVTMVTIEVFLDSITKIWFY